MGQAVTGDVLEGLRARDERAVEALIAQHGSRVWRLAFGVTGNAQDAEEVVQDVMLTVVRKHDSFAGRAALGTWIYRVAMNAAINKCRGKRRRLEVSIDALLPAFGETGERQGDPAELLADWSQRPDAEAEWRETLAVLRDAVAELPLAYRAVLTLSLEGLDNDAIASVLDVSVPAVKARLHRARMAVRERLARHLAAA